MKTHDLGDALITLGRILKKSPDCNLKDVKSFVKSKSDKGSTLEVAVNIDSLVELSKINKNKWLEFINEYGVNIEVRPRDAARDLLDKILRYLQSNDRAREDFKNKINKKKNVASPELINALGSLMRED